MEAKLDSRETAMALRRAFVMKKKNGFDFGKLHLANSVTLSTRIRCDILRAIANQYSVEGTTDMYISAYSSRPVLHVKETGQQGQFSSFALTFKDSVARYGAGLEERFLNDVYRKVGVSFHGQLEQHFIVLKDEDVGRIQNQAQNTSGQRGRGTFQGRPRGQNFRGGRGFNRGGNSANFTQQGTKRSCDQSGLVNTNVNGTGSGWSV